MYYDDFSECSVVDYLFGEFVGDSGGYAVFAECG